MEKWSDRENLEIQMIESDQSVPEVVARFETYRKTAIQTVSDIDGQRSFVLLITKNELQFFGRYSSELFGLTIHRGKLMRCVIRVRRVRDERPAASFFGISIWDSKSESEFYGMSEEDFASLTADQIIEFFKQEANQLHDQRLEEEYDDDGDEEYEDEEDSDDDDEEEGEDDNPDNHMWVVEENSEFPRLMDRLARAEQK